jgi:hypothetical protein
LEEENRKLEQLVADLSLDKKMLQDVLSKKTLRPAVKRVVVKEVQVAYRVAERRACRVLGFARSSFRVTEARTEDYNRVRPHGALGNRTPSEFARPLSGHAQITALHGEQPGRYHVGAAS